MLCPIHPAGPIKPGFRTSNRPFRSIPSTRLSSPALQPCGISRALPARMDCLSCEADRPGSSRMGATGSRHGWNSDGGSPSLSFPAACSRLRYAMGLYGIARWSGLTIVKFRTAGSATCGVCGEANTCARFQEWSRNSRVKRTGRKSPHLHPLHGSAIPSSGKF